MKLVRVIYTKYDGSLHWHSWMFRLGEDDHGVWLGASAGHLSRRGLEPPVTLSYPHVMLLPRDRWWTAAFNTAGSRLWCYCDVTTVPAWSAGGDEVSMIDLDLDVGRVLADGRTIVMDEDEFAGHKSKFAYPETVVDQAESSAAWLAESISMGHPPFDGVSDHWLAQVSGLTDLEVPELWTLS